MMLADAMSGAFWAASGTLFVASIIVAALMEARVAARVWQWEFRRSFKLWLWLNMASAMFGCVSIGGLGFAGLPSVGTLQYWRSPYDVYAHYWTVLPPDLVPALVVTIVIEGSLLMLINLVRRKGLRFASMAKVTVAGNLASYLVLGIVLYAVLRPSSMKGVEFLADTHWITDDHTRVFYIDPADKGIHSILLNGQNPRMEVSRPVGRVDDHYAFAVSADNRQILFRDAGDNRFYTVERSTDSNSKPRTPQNVKAVEQYFAMLAETRFTGLLYSIEDDSGETLSKARRGLDALDGYYRTGYEPGYVVTYYGESCTIEQYRGLGAGGGLHIEARDGSTLDFRIDSGALGLFCEPAVPLLGERYILTICNGHICVIDRIERRAGVLCRAVDLVAPSRVLGDPLAYGRSYLDAYKSHLSIRSQPADIQEP